MAAVALIATGAGGNSAVASRIDSFRQGLAERGWQVTTAAPAVRSHSTPISKDPCDPDPDLHSR